MSLALDQLVFDVLRLTAAKREAACLPERRRRQVYKAVVNLVRLPARCARAGAQLEKARSV